MCTAWPLWRGRGHTSLLCSTATQSPLSTEPQSRKEVTLAHMPKPESEQLELHKHVQKTTELSKKRPDRVRAWQHRSSLMHEGLSPTPTREPQEGKRKPDRKMAVAYARGLVTSCIPSDPQGSPPIQLTGRTAQLHGTNTFS